MSPVTLTRLVQGPQLASLGLSCEWSCLTFPFYHSSCNMMVGSRDVGFKARRILSDTDCDVAPSSKVWWSPPVAKPRHLDVSPFPVRRTSTARSHPFSSTRCATVAFRSFSAWQSPHTEARSALPAHKKSGETPASSIRAAPLLSPWLLLWSTSHRPPTRQPSPSSPTASHPY
jgi:hypothetical protein